MGCCSSRPTVENDRKVVPQPAKINTGKRFRLLIIGKTGSGKTTILSKVCGEDVADAPSTCRGHHDIEKEIVFQNNDKLVAHDSEGFEAGKVEEVAVVRNFIEKRNKEEDVYQRLHMVWYCIEMNSRPIQRAELDFFSAIWQVPVLAIITKFDTFVQDVLQRLEEENEEEEEIDDAELEEKAKQVAKEKFNKHYRDPLLALPHPPKAVLALSETHKSTPNDSRLTELIQETLKALSRPTEEINLSMANELTLLFATAQSADTRPKLEACVRKGFQDNCDTWPSSIERRAMLDVWNISWLASDSEATNIFMLCLSKDIDKGPRVIGNLGSPYATEVLTWYSNKLNSCKCEQMIADTALIMEQVFLLKLSNVEGLIGLVKWYERSPLPTYVRTEIMREHRKPSNSRLVGMGAFRLVDIVLGKPHGVASSKF